MIEEVIAYFIEAYESAKSRKYIGNPIAYALRLTLHKYDEYFEG